MVLHQKNIHIRCSTLLATLPSAEQQTEKPDAVRRSQNTSTTWQTIKANHIDNP